ncbi:caspase family protein [Nannocystis sp. SCPEA4]|uniref:caspase family protein n=1 Tax=Nannocystis sp. SCPEA4 TaxID=2996787 RepID=UPI00226DC615|nr:caspase family protein [Nannocystis sp. SCPEA4]MCY1059119.1 caspase family protein [Nannocystis sp. SCPEA4]
MPRALLIGASYGDLDVGSSVDTAHAWLSGHVLADAQIERLVGPQATRDGILAGLRRLGDEDHGDAPVVVYYAGHGLLYRSPMGAVEHGAHVAYPLLVPGDIDDTTGETLHAVFASELSRELRRIARRARNLTVILDCCHASGMVRLDDEVEDDSAVEQERALHREASARIAGKRKLGVRGVGDERLSDRVVVVVASSAGGRAYLDPVTRRMAFTEALLASLATRSSWDAVVATTRARVQEVWPIQQPAVFGPRFRRPFTLDEQLPEHELYRVERVGDDIVLMAGALRQIHLGDRFELIPGAGVGESPASASIAAQPRLIEPDRTLLWASAGVEVLPCHARRIHRGCGPVVEVACAERSLRGALSDLVAAAGLRVADVAGEVAARIEVRDGHVNVHDCLGALVLLAPSEPLSADELVRCLRRLDVWRGVSRWLFGTRGEPALGRCYDLRWGALTSSGIDTAAGIVRVLPGASLAVSLVNLDRGAPELYAHAFRIGADREIRAWSAGTGARFFAAHQRIDVADLQAGSVHAHRIDAPPSLPPGAYCEWTLVCVANEAFELDIAATPPMARTSPRAGEHTSWPAARGQQRARRFDVAVFPYILDLAALPR